MALSSFRPVRLQNEHQTRYPRRFERLERRNMLSATASMLGQEVAIPFWIPAERVPEVQRSIAAITSTGDDTPVHAQTDQSLGVVELDLFDADSQYAGIDGSGFSIAVLDTGANLDHPLFGP